MSERYRRFAMLTDKELQLAARYFQDRMTELRMGMNMFPNDYGQAGFLFEATFLWEAAAIELDERQGEYTRLRKEKKK